MNLDFIPIENPAILRAVKALPNWGYTKNKDEFVFLDIDDRFIHELFPLIGNPSLKKPDYFKDDVGAHISLVYPEEKIVIQKEFSAKHFFTVNGFFSARIQQKEYFVLGVHSPSLLALRKKYGLMESLLFKNYRVGLHITVGVRVVIPAQAQ